MDAQEELRDLLHQAREYLLYYRELGLTHIGEECAPSAAGEEGQAQVIESPATTLAAAEQIAPPPIAPGSEPVGCLDTNFARPRSLRLEIRGAPEGLVAGGF